MRAPLAWALLLKSAGGWGRNVTRDGRRSRFGGGPQAEGQKGRDGEGDPDTGDAGGPAVAVEDLAEDCTADETAEEVGRQIEPAGGAAVRRGSLADEPGRRGLGKEGADPHEGQSRQDGRQMGEDQQGQSC